MKINRVCSILLICVFAAVQTLGLLCSNTFAADRIIGDINGDSTISAVDYLLMKQYLISKNGAIPADISICDLDGDKAITVFDALLLKSYILRKIDKFPVQKETKYPDTSTVYIAGDSTVMTYSASAAPQGGWGQFIADYFTSDVKFVNKAIGGRSSKNFVTEGRLDNILKSIKANDYLFIQFGHNDAESTKPERYAAPYTTYKEYLKKYIDGARAHGAIPVLITPVGRLDYKNNIFVNDFPDYCNAMKQVASENKVALIDLMTKSLEYYTSIGYDNTYKLFMVSSNGTDHTHFTAKGATQIARLVSEGVKENKLLIAKYLKEVKTDPVTYKFNFGDGAAQPGYTSVKASTGYSRTLGYGFNTPQNMKNVWASGSGVASHAVQFMTYGTKSANTFNVDLSNGLYEVKVILGNTARSSVAAEGVYQLINMTGNNATDKFQIPITDGQLNILVTEGKTGTAFTLSALEIEKISDKEITGSTIYIGGDSTVCNYYPLDTSAQAGWGQILPKFIDTTKFQVRNMSSSGQCARGFHDDGQFEAIMKYLKAGDVFILQFGINDTNPKNSETSAQFEEIMTDMVKKAKATGATVVLSTPQGRSTDFNSSNVHTAANRWYRQTTLEIAKEQSVQLIDLNVLSSAYFTSIGSKATLELFMAGDSLHINRAGATKLAEIVSANLKLPNAAN